MVHQRGFVAASVRDIVREAGVPQGSFTNHWASKEAFGLAVLDAYSGTVEALIAATLRDPGRPALDRMRAYLAAVRGTVGGAGLHCGCMLGNMSAESDSAGEAIRHRVVEIFGTMRADIAHCLDDAAREGVLPAGTDRAELACVILSSLQGAILLAKAERSTTPIDRFERLLFSVILPATPPA